MPLVPAGASGSRARTACTMFEVKSCSPHEMKILVPEIEYEPSSRGSARVVSWPRSEPHCGSVRHIVPVNSPATSGGRYFALRASEPWASSVLMHPFERPANMPHDQHAVAIISPCTSASETGSA